MFNIAKQTDLEALKKQVEELTKIVESLQKAQPVNEPAKDGVRSHTMRPEGYYGEPIYKTLKEVLETLKVPYDPNVTEYTFERNGWLITIRPLEKREFHGLGGTYVVTIGADLKVEKYRRYYQTRINVTKQRTVANRVEVISTKPYVREFQKRTMEWVNKNFKY